MRFVALVVLDAETKPEAQEVLSFIETLDVIFLEQLHEENRPENAQDEKEADET